MLSIDSRNYQIRDELAAMIIIKSETIQTKDIVHCMRISIAQKQAIECHN